MLRTSKILPTGKISVGDFVGVPRVGLSLKGPQ